MLSCHKRCFTSSSCRHQSASRQAPLVLCLPPSLEAIEVTPPLYISAPLKRVPSPLPPSSPLLAPHYLSLALRLPHAATSSQRRDGKTGITIDLILDTGSTVNVIQPQVANELALSIVGTQPAGAGAGGGISAAPIFLLGDIQFDHLAPEERFLVMSGLQAASLNVPSPSSAGILGRPFLDSFAAVEFVFPSNDSPDEIRFYLSELDVSTEGKSRVKMSTLGISGLWGVDLTVSNPTSDGDDGSRVVMKALVDTGAPTTIINKAAAQALGLNVTEPIPSPSPTLSQESKGLFGGLMGKIQSGIAKQASQLSQGVGVQGLKVSPTAVSLSLSSAPSKPLSSAPSNKEEDLQSQDKERPMAIALLIDLGSWHPLIGDLPGFAVLGVENGEPAAILGLDALRYKGSLTIFPRSIEMVL